MSAGRLEVVRATVRVSGTGSAEWTSRVGCERFFPVSSQRVGGLTSKQPAQRPELEFFALDERSAAVQAAVALSAEGGQGHLVASDFPIGEGRGRFAFRVFMDIVAERSDEFQPGLVQHPKPDGQTSRLIELTLNVHRITFLQRSQLLMSRRGHF